MVNGNGSQRCQRHDGPVTTARRPADLGGKTSFDRTSSAATEWGDLRGSHRWLTSDSAE